MATELNLNTLNWVTLACPSCESSVEVLAEDLAIADSIRCPGCGSPITDQAHDEVDDSTETTPVDEASQDLSSDTHPDFELETTSELNDPGELNQLIKSLPDSEDDCSASEPELEPTLPLEVEAPETSPELTESKPVEVDAEFDRIALTLSAESDEEETEPATRRERVAEWFRSRRRQLTGTLASIAVHLVLLGVLGLIVFQIGALDESGAIDGRISTGADDAELLIVNEIPTEEVTIEPTPNQLDLLRITRQQNDPTARAGTGEVTEISLEGPDGLADTLTSEPRWQTPTGQGLEGRTAEDRARLAMLHGGSEKSEAAVEEGLKWLIRHQRPDGSWNFRHRLPTCPRRCLDEGRHNCPTGATGMALLCFLGAGYTHQAGPYQDEVGKALKWLVDQSCLGDLRYDPSRDYFLQGNTGFYNQGLASIALCEAYGMTKDPALREPAQDALDFIAMSQDPIGGGWRYDFQQAGDTSVVGWQVMAMVSGRMADLDVARSTRSKVLHFLNQVYDPTTKTFGYTDRYGRATSATTSIGILCTMYLDPLVARRTLRDRVERLSRTSPIRENLYSNYYTSQILHHFGGENWNRWNSRMRKSLVTAQLSGGHGAGSWYSNRQHDVSGGRLYSTCMSILILEVYYRHLPLYQDDATMLTIPQGEATE